MATWNDVRKIALALPDTEEKTTRGKSAWTVGGKLFVWERPLGKSDLKALGASAPTGEILGARMEDLEMKEALLGSDPEVFFTIPHFDGYPAVLVLLAEISKARLRDVIVDSWLARAPKHSADAFLQKMKPRASRDVRRRR